MMPEECGGGGFRFLGFTEPPKPGQIRASGGSGAGGDRLREADHPDRWREHPVRELPDGPKSEASRCRSCGAPVEWRMTAAGKRSPYDLDGTSHFATCPDAARWRRRAKTE